jgi:thioredoxin 2
MLQLNCPHCYATNRLPAERLGDKPNCGRCKQALFDGKPLTLTPTNFSTTLEKNDIPIVVDCWAPWCGPCQTFGPVFSQAAAQCEPRARFAKLDTQANPGIAQQLAIRSIPTLLVFKDGKEVQRLSGALPLPQFRQWLMQAGI